MSLPFFPVLSEADAPEEARALFTRFHEKFGPAPIPTALLRAGNSPAIFRDALMNLEKVVGEKGEIPRAERITMALGIAAAIQAPSLATWLDALAAAAGVPDAKRKAAIEAAITCRTYNAYYRSKSLFKDEKLEPIQVNLRATPFAQSALEKKWVELTSFAVSVAMGCASCTAAHAGTSRQHGVTDGQLDEIVRAQAVLSGLAALDS